MSQAGKFRELITLFYAPVPVPDGAGGWLGSTSETNSTSYAQVQQQAAKEDLVNGKITYRQLYKITVRAGQTANLTNLARIEWKGIKMSIVSFTTDERQTQTIIRCYANC